MLNVQTPAATTAARRPHLWQIDLIRIAPMLGMASTHVVLYTVPANNALGGAALMFLHVSREIFLFVSAFILFYTTEGYERAVPPFKFWKRRVPLIAIPYLLWTLIYWPLSGGASGSPQQALTTLGLDLSQGWFHLYFLLLTLQLYLVFPLLAWFLRRTRRHHAALLLGSLAVQVAATWAMQYQWPPLPSPLVFWMEGSQNELSSYQLYIVAGALAAIHYRRCLEWLRSHPQAAAVLVAAGLLGGEAWYLANLHLGQPAAVASNVFQPAVVALVLSSILGLWMLAERWLLRYSLDGAVWGTLRKAADASFGFYLAHMVVLLLITREPLLAILPTDKLPIMQATLARLALVIAGTTALVWLIRRTPFSRVLTGRTGAPLRTALAPRGAESPGA